MKRLFASLTARVDKLVSDIENHDAVVEAGVRNARQAYAKAKVRHTRLVQEGERLRRKLSDLRKSEVRWKERALSAADEDEDVALECVRRRRLCGEQAEFLEQALERHQTLEARLARKLEAAGQHVDQLGHQRQIMRSREATAEVASRLAGMEETPAVELQDAFERWEVRITEAELAAGQPETGDTFDSTFKVSEEHQDLQAELASLKQLKREMEAKHED
jgi:phage shock protein A